MGIHEVSSMAAYLGICLREGVPWNCVSSRFQAKVVIRISESLQLQAKLVDFVRLVIECDE